MNRTISVGSLFVFVLLATDAQSQCASPEPRWQIPSSMTFGLCVNRTSPSVSTHKISSAVGMWADNCSSFGSGLPNLIANSTNILECDLLVWVDFNSGPNPLYPNAQSHVLIGSV
jgi:hypothetical protein